jgi:epoxyqueuosine reductase QueG
VYTKKFGFHHNIWTFGIRNCVTNLPTRNIPNYYYADICNNCNECIKNCPAHAIHGDQYPGWLDRLRCIQFYHYGEHPYIPSIKYEINKFLNYPHSEEELK